MGAPGTSGAAIDFVADKSPVSGAVAMAARSSFSGTPGSAAAAPAGELTDAAASAKIGRASSRNEKEGTSENRIAAKSPRIVGNGADGILTNAGSEGADEPARIDQPVLRRSFRYVRKLKCCAIAQSMLLWFGH